MQSLMFSLIYDSTNDLANNRDAVIRDAIMLIMTFMANLLMHILFPGLSQLHLVRLQYYIK